MIRRLIILNWK